MSEKQKSQEIDQSQAKDQQQEADQPKEAPSVLGLGSKETDIGTIFINEEYRIKRFVSTVTDLINLNHFDLDHELEDFTSRLIYDGFKEDIGKVLESQEKMKKEVAEKSGRCYLMELQPYQTQEGVKGVVINFVDISDLKEAEKKLSEKVVKIKDLQRQIIKNDVKERWEIGQYLHDELAQSLLSAKFMASHLKGELKGEGKDHSEEMEQLLDILDRSIAGARDLSHEIVPIDVEEEGVSHSFSKLAQQMEKMHDTHCQVNLDSTVNKLKNIEMATHLYRVAHEAAKNAAVHGEADNITISLKSDDEFLYLYIEDDGKGFSKNGEKEGGKGINIMRHRMELIGGTLTIQDSTDASNNGAMIACRIPMEVVEQGSES